MPIKKLAQGQESVQSSSDETHPLHKTMAQVGHPLGVAKLSSSKKWDSTVQEYQLRMNLSLSSHGTLHHERSHVRGTGQSSSDSL